MGPLWAHSIYIRIVYIFNQNNVTSRPADWDHGTRPAAILLVFWNKCRDRPNPISAELNLLISAERTVRPNNSSVFGPYFCRTFGFSEHVRCSCSVDPYKSSGH